MKGAPNKLLNIYAIMQAIYVHIMKITDKTFKLRMSIGFYYYIVRKIFHEYLNDANKVKLLSADSQTVGKDLTIELILQYLTSSIPEALKIFRL